MCLSPGYLADGSLVGKELVGKELVILLFFSVVMFFMMSFFFFFVLSFTPSVCVGISILIVSIPERNLYVHLITSRHGEAKS